MGKPYRTELNDPQEVQPVAVMRRIVAFPYNGFVAHQSPPTVSGPLVSASQAINLCDV